MKLYLAGPMTGIKDFNYPAFHAAAKALRAAGYEVVNPAEIALPAGCEGKGTDDPAALKQFMKLDLPLLLGCDGLCLLPGWEQSRGARIESGLAAELQYPRGDVEGWVRERVKAVNGLELFTCDACGKDDMEREIYLDHVQFCGRAS